MLKFLILMLFAIPASANTLGCANPKPIAKVCKVKTVCEARHKKPLKKKKSHKKIVKKIVKPLVCECCNQPATINNITNNYYSAPKSHVVIPAKPAIENHTFQQINTTPLASMGLLSAGTFVFLTRQDYASNQAILPNIAPTQTPLPASGLLFASALMLFSVKGLA